MIHQIKTKSHHIMVCFENPKLNFCTSFSNMTKKEIRNELIGETYNFCFKGQGMATCIDVVFQE
ncbi:hypothetical protein EV196_11341 [Mariniflexile fucanivorans]|uniref:Uncharacterized protein n=1 Tax=Mariniflexile fucanivorans TaxID=264023 RepID=A0A4R1RA51_9FLAO|nr:hypothetical protein EV196_11341 [Mariniflexile fucanivorans]